MKTKCNNHSKQSNAIPRNSKDFPKIFALGWICCGFGYQELFSEDVKKIGGEWSDFTDHLCNELFNKYGGWLNGGGLIFYDFLSPSMKGNELLLTMQSNEMIYCLIRPVSKP